MTEGEPERRDDAPEPGTPEAGVPESGRPESGRPQPRTEAVAIGRRARFRAVAKPAALVLLGAVVVANLVFIGRTLPHHTTPPDAKSAAPIPSGAAPQSSADSSTDGEAPPALDKAEANEPSSNEPSPSDTDSDETPTIHQDEPPARHARKAQTVGQAFASGCSTASVDGLSRQIVAEARCIDADAFAIVPPRPNLVVAGHVSLRLEAPARDELLRVLDAHPHRTMTINSAFRTVAQQYLLDRWSRTKRCGIELAAHPGESNHETGLALDVKEHGTWRAALESQGFRWLGPSDRVHFDFKGPGTKAHDGLDVLAFQRLWNRNHPDDAIAENGRYDAPTESHLKKAPALGFAKGPQNCTHARQADRAVARAHETR